MVRRIIPLNKIYEDAESVTYEWGHPTIDRCARIVKVTSQVEPMEGTTHDEALVVLNYLTSVRLLNAMEGWPSEAPIYQ